MARTLLSVMAAVAVCLVRADPTPAPSAPQSSVPTTTTATGPQPFNLDNIIGKWRSYFRKPDKYYSCDMDIVKKTPAEIAVLKEQFLSQTQTHQLADVSWENISLCIEMNINGQNETLNFLIEAMTDPSYIKLISSEGDVGVTRIKVTDEKITLRQVNGDSSEVNLYRTLPDLEKFAYCQGFDNVDTSDAVDADFVVGTWTPIGYPEESPIYMRVHKKTMEEVAAYRDDLRNTTIEEADIDWTKVRVEVEIVRENDSWAQALIEFLDKPGSIRVIPLRATWDRFDMANNDWFRSQNFIIKNDDDFLAVKNCHERRQEAYLSRRPESRRRTKIWKVRDGKPHITNKHSTYLSNSISG